MPIQILPPAVISRIAAGEVIDRPAAVVKELVENSLDAGATQIAVEVQGGGRKLIKVTDNGHGIPTADVAVVFRRHATSKLSRVEDLDSIATLGFRGEALPSMGAVAEVELATRAAPDAVGSRVINRYGDIVLQEHTARPQGTTVSVYHLFGLVPARLKFLKSVAVENGYARQVVSRYALAYPEVKFSLSFDNRLALTTSGSGELRNAASEIYSARIGKQLLVIAHEQDTVRVTGLVSPLGLFHHDAAGINFFVNRRWTRPRSMYQVVRAVYPGLSHGDYPVVIANISLPPTDVDVNVHPAKTEVKFRQEGAVYRTVEQAIRRELGKSPLAAGTLSVGFTPAEFWQEGTGSSLPFLRLIGQLSETYILAESPRGLYLIDQHAAHERVLFEHILSQLGESRLESQALLEPVTIEVSAMQDKVLRDNAPLLTQFGFLLEVFGAGSYLIRGVPAVLHSADPADTLREVMDALAGNKSPEITHAVASSMACHGAVRAGQRLSGEEMSELLIRLEKAEHPHICPHGRPAVVYVGVRELEKHFSR
ncbi:MAG: DNA mismatch repair endonuclease MutL [Chloroflexota bacterium]